MIHVLVPSFVEIGKAEVAKPMHGIYDEKIFKTENFTGSLVAHSPSLC